MGLIAKFTGGKRVNYCSGESFKRRCFGAGLSHTAGPSWHLSPWKKLHGSPGSIFKKKILARERRRVKRRLIFASKPFTSRRRRTGNCDREYGPLALQPDITNDDMEQRCLEFLKKLKDEASTCPNPEIETLGQHTNQLWIEKRMNRLTASKFGAVIKRMPHTSCHNLLKTILYPKNLKTEAVTFGRDNEDFVIQMYEAKTSNVVKKTGLHIAPEHPFLGASPDGLVSDEGLIEIKCLSSTKDRNLMEEVQAKKDICLELNNNQLRLKRNHNYYYQVQGQLNVTKRQWCDFVVYTKTGELFIERIKRDKLLWQDKMLPKLIRFYTECMLPELVDSRIVRGMKARDPPFIINAQTAKQQKQIKKIKSKKNVNESHIKDSNNTI